MLALPRFVDAGWPFLVFGTFFVVSVWSYGRVRRMSHNEQMSRLRSTERQLGFPDVVTRSPAVALTTLFLGATTSLVVMVAELVDSRAIVWLAIACAVTWLVATAVMLCVGYTGHPRFLVRRGLPEYKE